jgi:hypothetical protein
MKGERFVVVEMTGSGSQAVGFVEGYRLGSGHKGPVWFAGREEMDVDGFLTKLREKLHLELNVVMLAEFAEAVIAALEDAPMVQVKAQVTTDAESAELEFKFKCYSREEAEAVKALVRGLPGEVRLEDYEEEEAVNPEAKGVELYSPVHEYEFSGKGRYVGSVAGVIAMAHELAENDFIQAERIQLSPPD